MRFVDTIGMIGFCTNLVLRRDVFVRDFSFAARLMRRLLFHCGFSSHGIRRLEIGDLISATGIRQVAYDKASLSVMKKPYIPWFKDLSARLELNVQTLADRIWFEKAYDEFMFVGMLLAFANENPEDQHNCGITTRAAEAYATEFNLTGNLLMRQKSGLLTFYWPISILLKLSALIIYYSIYVAISRRSENMDGSNVCIVDAPSTFFMMKNLFDDKENVRYVYELQYFNCFPDNFLYRNKIKPIEINKRVYLRCLIALPVFLSATIREIFHSEEASTLIVSTLHVLLKAIDLTPSGKDICVITSEHLTTPRSARNEWIRSIGGSSIYISQNSYVTYQQLPSERQLNYDVFCAAGQHALDLYAIKSSITNVFHITGSYDSHRLDDDSEEKYNRQKKLNKFRGDKVLVVFLTPGICNETYSNELRLLQMARNTSYLPEVKVIVRRKPGSSPEPYTSFYEENLPRELNIWVTAGEFDLFDFVGVADLFVTSISTSACDIAHRGGDVMFIDFMKTPDLYIPWVKVPSIVFSEKDALSFITRWVQDRPDDLFRSAHAISCKEFSDYIGQRYEDFYEYKRNLLDKLRPWIRCASVGESSKIAKVNHMELFDE